MTLFSFAVHALKNASEQYSMGIFLSPPFQRKLNALDTDPTNIALQCELVEDFLRIKREESLHAFLTRNLPGLYAFKKNIKDAIIEKTSFNLSQIINYKEGLFLTSLHPKELKICAEYYLMKAKIWSIKKQSCIESHTQLHAVVKSMALLHHRHLLTSDYFDFITKSDGSEDITYLLAALETMCWLNQENLKEVRSQYKFKLGEVCLLSAHAQIGQRENFVYLNEHAREILIRESEKNIHPIYIQSALTHFSKKSTAIQIKKDHHYLHSPEPVSMRCQELLECIAEPASHTSNFFENRRCKNHFMLNHLRAILSLSASDMPKLHAELDLLKIPLGRFIFNQDFLDVLINNVKKNGFSSSKTVIELLDENNSLDAHIITNLYHIPNLNPQEIFSTIKWLLSQASANNKHGIIRFFLESNQVTHLLKTIKKTRATLTVRYPLWIMIHPQSLYVTDQITNRYSHLCTEKFIFYLKWQYFLETMLWALHKANPLPCWDALTDTHFINLSTLPHKKEIMQILDTTQDCISVDFFDFITQKHPSKYIKEICSILPILAENNLARTSTLKNLILYLESQPIQREISTLIIDIKKNPGRLCRTLDDHMHHIKPVINTSEHQPHHMRFQEEKETEIPPSSFELKVKL